VPTNASQFALELATALLFENCDTCVLWQSRFHWSLSGTSQSHGIKSVQQPLKNCIRSSL